MNIFLHPKSIDYPLIYYKKIFFQFFNLKYKKTKIKYTVVKVKKYRRNLKKHKMLKIKKLQTKIKKVLFLHFHYSYYIFLKKQGQIIPRKGKF